jgi:outer membrane protein assembly factor BamB
MTACKLLLLTLAASTLPAADVVQHHNHGNRDGLYIDPGFTRDIVSTLHRDPTFHAPLNGPVYAQPLYVGNGAGGNPTLIVATEQNQVLALSAADGSPIWTANLGTPVPLSKLPCGDIDPLGITGTPVVDPNNRVIYADAMTTPDAGATKLHRVFALSLDDGSVLPGWPFDLSNVRAQGVAFNSTYQNQRGALLLQAGVLYIPYGGHDGDCGNYHGWVVAIPVSNPTAATGWPTGATAGGIWAPGGVATDGTSVFAVTGNTENARTWMGGEAVVRLGPGATFTGNTADYFVPSNWQDLDAFDLDVGGSGPLPLDVPGATPSQLLVALGKNGVAYLLDRNYLGGLGTGDGTVGEGLLSAKVDTGSIINAAATYATASGTYVVFASGDNGVGCPGDPGDLVALKIGAGSPPTISVAWCAENLGGGSPIVTTTDGFSDSIVWTVGAEYTNQLHGYNAETGELLFAGGGPDEHMGNVRHFQVPIVAGGRIFVAGDEELYAFTLDTRGPNPARKPRTR